MSVKIKQLPDKTIAVTTSRPLKPMTADQYAELEEAVVLFKEEKVRGAIGVEVDAEVIGITYPKGKE